MAKGEKAEGIVVRFVWERDTKGTHVFKECDQGGTPIEGNTKIGGVYIRKGVLTGNPGAGFRIKMAITEGAD